MAVQDQVKTRPGNIVTPFGVNTLSGFTYEKERFFVWVRGGGLVFHHMNEKYGGKIEIKSQWYLAESGFL